LVAVGNRTVREATKEQERTGAQLGGGHDAAEMGRAILLLPGLETCFQPSSGDFTMWIFLSNAMLSIVDKGGDGSTLLVRARRREDLTRVFPKAKVQAGGGTDYPFRARIDREEVAMRVAEAVLDIHYPNFKATVAEDVRHTAYLRVWADMMGFQDQSNRS
jgi:hypothetical protein